MFVFVAKLLTSAVSPVMLVCELLAIALLAGRRKPGLARKAAAAALLLLVLASNGLLSDLLVRHLESRIIPATALPDAQAIVVLSSDVKPAIAPQPAITLDDASANRLLYGAQLYRAGKAPTVILSGGQMPWSRGLPPMSQSMADVIELLGVPKSSIIQEADSANTYQNAIDVRALLKRRHIGRVLLVTSAMHMPRALALFKRRGIDAIAAPCDFKALGAGAWSDTASWQDAALHLIPDANALAMTSLAWKEYLGIAVYHAAGLL